MINKKSLVSLVAALALSASIAGPAFAAGPPTYSGPLTCISTVNGDVVDIETQVMATNQEIAAYKKRVTVEQGFCEPGSVDTSGLVKDA